MRVANMYLCESVRRFVVQVLSAVCSVHFVDLSDFYLASRFFALALPSVPSHAILAFYVSPRYARRKK